MPAAQIVKWGNSLAVRIPKPVAEQAGVQEGDPIVIEAAKGDQPAPEAENSYAEGTGGANHSGEPA
jgi:antitoxin component of MazEF toxin-antitoxin module